MGLEKLFYVGSGWVGEVEGLIMLKAGLVDGEVIREVRWVVYCLVRLGWWVERFFV